MLFLFFHHARPMTGKFAGRGLFLFFPILLSVDPPEPQRAPGTPLRPFIHFKGETPLGVVVAWWPRPDDASLHSATATRGYFIAP